MEVGPDWRTPGWRESSAEMLSGWQILADLREGSLSSSSISGPFIGRGTVKTEKLFSWQQQHKLFHWRDRFSHCPRRCELCPPFTYFLVSSKSSHQPRLTEASLRLGSSWRAEGTLGGLVIAALSGGWRQAELRTPDASPGALRQGHLIPTPRAMIRQQEFHRCLPSHPCSTPAISASCY